MAVGGDVARRAAERVARESYGRLVAFLAARSGDIAGAEDALGDAFAAALRVWAVDGVPANPDAWLLTAARRRLADAHRRRHTREAGEAHQSLMAEEIEAAATARGDIPDRRLALMFACAHPDIEPAMRAPLILQTLLGLTAAEIAAAFLIPAATMSQRLVRAKTRIREAGIPLRPPDQEALPERVAAVLEAVYAAYTTGWAEIDAPHSARLTEEAVWLGQVVVAILPNEPEAKGMLALMLYSSARHAARRSPGGVFVPLDEQDIRLWDRQRIARAERRLRQANTAGPSGRYQVEAAIQSAHTARRIHGQSNWPDIVALYDYLIRCAPSPVVALNRAVARANVDGPAAALTDIEPLLTDRRMLDYQPYWAARGRLCAEAGRLSDAREALTLAIGLSADPAVRDYLTRQRDHVGARA